MSDARGGESGTDPDAERTATDEETARAAGGRPCPRCDRPMFHRHCKYVCPEHGVVFDCADTFY
jgi:hypothetical protein